MKLVVTGATGFVGTHLTKQLVADGHQVTAVVRPQSNFKMLPEGVTRYVYEQNILSLISFLKEGSFDGVIHLAAHCPTSHQSEEIARLINANILFSTEMLEAAASSGIKWFINTGSYMQHFDNHDYSPSILYAATKQAFFDITRYWSDCNKINIVTLELFDNFGKGDTRKKIFTLWRQAFETGETIDMSPGLQIMDVSPVENVVAAFSRLANLLEEDTEHKLNGRVFSLATKDRRTLKDWAELFQKITNKKLNINWGKRPYRDREIMVPWTGESIPGYQPVISVEDAIKNYLET